MRPPLVREFQRTLADVGCSVRRKPAGSHEVWETPGGRSFVLVVNHLADPVSRGVYLKAKRLLGAEGIEL